MRCKKSRSHFSAYLDQELPDEKAQNLEQHLNECPKCEEEFKNLRNYLRIAQSLDRVKAPEILSERIQASLSSPMPIKSRLQRNPIIYMPVAVVAALLLISLFIWPPGFFQADNAEIPYVFEIKKRGKGPVSREKKGDSPSENKVKTISEIVKANDGLVKIVDQDQYSGEPNFMIIQVPASNYASFRNDYHSLLTYYSLPDDILADRDGMIYIQIGFSRRQLLVDDFNADGRSDIAIFMVRGNREGRIYVAENVNESEWLYPVAVQINTEGYQFTDNCSLLSGDIDGDLRQDILIIPEDEPARLYYQLNKGDGRYRDAKSISLSGDFKLSDGIFMMTDLNGDSLTDLVFHYVMGDHKGQWLGWLNTGDRQFAYPIEIVTGHQIPSDQMLYKPFSIDMNNDGFDDLGVYYNSGARDASWFVTLNDGQGHFKNEQRLFFGKSPIAFQGNYAVFTGDVNADGFDDLLIKLGGVNDYSSWSVLINSQKNSFDDGHKIKFNNESDLPFY